MSAKAGQLNFTNYICAINIPCLRNVFPRKTGKRVSLRINPPLIWMLPPLGWMTPPPPPSFDDAASTASQESHVTSPVVMMPLNQDLIDANLTVE